MKKIEPIAENTNYTAVNMGSLDEIKDHSLIHPKTQQLIEGKVFLKESTKSTGTEISFNTLPPKTELSYFHIHTNNEETYIFLKGSGDFQVDEDCFPIKEGSVVRVSPSGVRGLRNSSDEPMVYMVIQSTEGSLGKYTTEDGRRVDHESKWSL
ncbi:Cupin domain-containing protein [Dysgonomonas alginatilytica]|uniref:Cupin domain-containing protein n=1 Tax=Dysgonomonas alginatilytica TaxID=1605892 RepID=A0A2V3PU16_9BACT|nr:cupin domain-containing protein [Dysgonomonas alginatilytica]PXV68072.1 Cupin domain-containing protein [Dysgonomonas alginatilytica]